MSRRAEDKKDKKDQDLENPKSDQTKRRLQLTEATLLPKAQSAKSSIDETNISELMSFGSEPAIQLEGNLIFMVQLYSRVNEWLKPLGRTPKTEEAPKKEADTKPEEKKTEAAKPEEKKEGRRLAPNKNTRFKTTKKERILLSPTIE